VTGEHCDGFGGNNGFAGQGGFDIEKIQGWTRNTCAQI